jgi:LysR family nitrogen assimilation transcriptional regulator
MNLRQLGYFVEIAKLQSITRAADVLHVAQPSLSRHIQMLEHELGVLLLVRSDKGVTLTEAGSALLERASAVLQQVRQIRDELGLHAKAPHGELSFGVPPSLFDLLTVPLLAEFRVRYPEVRLQVIEGVSAVMHEMVLTGKLDTAIVSDAEPMGMMRSRDLFKEQLYLAGPPDADLDMGTQVPVASLAERPLILTSKPNAMRVIVESAIAQAGHRIQPTLESNSSRLLCELVSRGGGFTVLPFTAVYEAFRAGQLKIAPVTDLSVTWTLITSRERTLSLAGQKLRDMMSDVGRRHIKAGDWTGITPLS